MEVLQTISVVVIKKRLPKHSKQQFSIVARINKSGQYFNMSAKIIKVNTRRFGNLEISFHSALRTFKFAQCLIWDTPCHIKTGENIRIKIILEFYAFYQICLDFLGCLLTLIVKWKRSDAMVRIRLLHCTKNTDLVTFTEEFFNGKLHFLCSVGGLLTKLL